MKSLLKNLSIALVGLSSVFALAQDYPVKPVKILVGYVAGGSPDFVARALAQKLTDILGQPFVVENRPGGVV
jgi:tripartite-type tricarboxylate transporter receptor subunit TctC